MSHFRRSALLALSAVSIAGIIDNNFYSIRPLTGPSMYPTIPFFSIPLIRKINPWSSVLKKGDIVLAVSNANPDTWIIKRLVAVEGESVVVDDGCTVLVPRGHVWLVGDNPKFSTDSNTFGPVSRNMIHGILIAQLYP